MPLERDVAKTSGVVSAATSSTPVLAANPSRLEVTISNDGANVVYLGLQTIPGTLPTAVVNAGIRLGAAGTSGSTWRDEIFTGAIAAIATTGATNITVVEL